MNAGKAARAALTNTAHHEAAHAVAAYFLHQSVRTATIRPTRDGKTLGHVRHHRLQFAKAGVFDETPLGVDRAEKHIIICFAGPIASRKLQPRCQWRASGASDFETAADLLSRVAGEDARHYRLYYKLLWRRAELLVLGRWRAIQAVARGILSRETLNASEIRDAIDSAYGLKPFGAA